MLARGTDTNRSFTAVEANVIQQLNRALADHDVGWQSFNEFVWRGAANSGLLGRTALGDEPRIGRPAWAADAAVKDGKRFADQIRESGVGIAGDLDQLSAEPPPADHVDSDTIPAETVVRALTGVILAGASTKRRAERRSAQLGATNRRLETERAKSGHLKAQLTKVRQELSDEKKLTLYHRVRKLSPTERPDQTAAAYTPRELLAGLKRRIKHNLFHARDDNRQARGMCPRPRPSEIRPVSGDVTGRLVLAPASRVWGPCTEHPRARVRYRACAAISEPGSRGMGRVWRSRRRRRQLTQLLRPAHPGRWDRLPPQLQGWKWCYRPSLPRMRPQ